MPQDAQPDVVPAVVAVSSPFTSRDVINENIRNVKEENSMLAGSLDTWILCILEAGASLRSDNIKESMFEKVVPRVALDADRFAFIQFLNCSSQRDLVPASGYLEDKDERA
jgi:hypothetical protein